MDARVSEAGTIAGWLLAVFASLALLVPAGAAELDAPVVTVNGEAITLRQLEDELLRKEGVEEAAALVGEFLQRIDWSRLTDDDVIVEIAGQKLTRLDLAAHLLRERGAEVRKELMHITMVRQALAKHDVELTDELLVEEYRRQERRFAERMAEHGENQIGFADFLRIKEGKTVGQWMAEEGFRMAAALHELVHRRSEIPEELLRTFYQREFERRYAQPEALRLSVITRRWPTVRIDGREVVDPARKEGVMATMRRLGQDLHSGKLSFEQAWQHWGKAFDPQSEGGDAGWIDRRGDSDRVGARTIPEEVMDLAWGVRLREGEPMLLPPVAHETGVDLIRIEAHREAQRPAYDAIRERVRRDYIEAHLDELTQAYMERLALEAKVDYHSLTTLMTERLEAAGQTVEGE